MAEGARGQTRVQLSDRSMPGSRQINRHGAAQGIFSPQRPDRCDCGSAISRPQRRIWSDLVMACTNRPTASSAPLVLRVRYFSISLFSRGHDVQQRRRALARWRAAGLHGNRRRRDCPAVVPRPEERGAAGVAGDRGSAKRLLVGRQPLHRVRLPESIEENESVGDLRKHCVRSRVPWVRGRGIRTASFSSDAAALVACTASQRPAAQPFPSPKAAFRLPLLPARRAPIPLLPSRPEPRHLHRVSGQQACPRSADDPGAGDRRCRHVQSQRRRPTPATCSSFATRIDGPAVR